MYPAFIKEAESESNKKAKWSFDVANKVEEIHEGLFKGALASMAKDAGADYHVCSVCGNTVLGEAPDKCPICGAAKDKFLRVE